MKVRGMSDRKCVTVVCVTVKSSRTGWNRLVEHEESRSNLEGFLRTVVKLANLSVSENKFMLK